MQVHDEAKIDMSIFWLKDRYNDVVEHACALGTKVGVRVDAARFYQTVKSDLDVGSICRDPVEVAYLNMQKQAETAPCCHWAEAKLPMDVYRDPEGFNRFWQQETLRKLRAKRDFASCKACGLTRAFDELMFHFTPFLKGKLIDSGNIAETELRNSYPDQELVRTCERIGLDLPSLRRTFLGLGLAPERLEKLKTDGLAALAEFDQVCWRAYRDSNPALSPPEQDLADCFWGIGWGRSEHQPNERVSGRWLWPGRKGSIFLRVPLTGTHKILLFAPHQRLNRAAFELRISGQPLALEFSSSGNHGSLISAEIPSNLPKADRGCLWIQCEIVGDPQSGAAPVLLSKFRIEKVPARERLQRHFNRTVGSVSGPIRLAASSCADARSSFERLFEARRTYWGEVFALLRSDPHEFFRRAKRRLRRD